MQNICVIDVECFGFRAEIIKKFGLCTKYFNGAIAFSAPTYSNPTLTDEDIRHNSWITRNLHGISWEAEGVSFEELQSVVRNFFSSPNLVIYSKGLQKCLFLQHTLGLTKVSNLEDLGWPKLSVIQPPSRPLTEISTSKKTQKTAPRVDCKAFPSVHKFNLNCAHRQAVCYFQWLQKKDFARKLFLFLSLLTRCNAITINSFNFLIDVVICCM